MNFSDISKCLSNPTRKELLHLIASTEETACLLIRSKYELSQPTISHHLSKMVEAGLITKYKRGTENYYSLNRNVLDQYIQELKDIYEESE